MVSSAFSEYFVFLDDLCQDKDFQQAPDRRLFLCLALLKKFPAELTTRDAKEIVNEWAWEVEV